MPAIPRIFPSGSLNHATSSRRRRGCHPSVVVRTSGCVEYHPFIFQRSDNLLVLVAHCPGCRSCLIAAGTSLRAACKFRPVHHQLRASARIRQYVAFRPADAVPAARYIALKLPRCRAIAHHDRCHGFRVCQHAVLDGGLRREAACSHVRHSAPDRGRHRRAAPRRSVQRSAP